jgi:hemerythrin superfamily protein
MATTTQRRSTASNGTASKSRSSSNDKSNFTSYGAIAGAASAGLAVGVLALLGRKAAVQAPTLLAGDWDEALTAEHVATLKVFDMIEATSDQQTTRRTLHLTQLKHALAKHAIQEENVIYPAMRDAGEVEGADELTKEHGYVKQYLFDLENMPKNSPAFLEKIRAFRRDIEEHMRDEEERLFPLLKAQLSEERNHQLTLQMNKEGFKLA